MVANLFSRLSETTQADRIFIQSPDGGTITYAAMRDRSARLANALVGLGVAPGDRVAVQVGKSTDALLLYLACLHAGAVYLPLNADYTLSELKYFFADSEPRLVVCAPEKKHGIAELAKYLGIAHVETLENGGGTGSVLEIAAINPAVFEDVPRHGSDLAAILYTSGTTGRSKGAMLTHGNLASNCFVLRDCWRFTDADVLLHALPIYHTHGLFVAVNIVMAAGASMILLPKFDPDTIFRFLPKATVLMGVPTFYVRLLQDARLTREATAHMRLFVSGSAPLLAETHSEFFRRTGHAILERYGMTETGMNTSNPYEGERIAGTVGFPLPDVALRICDPDTGAELPVGEIGMIEVRGPNVFKGYWRMPEKTAAEFRSDGFFMTGDLGRIDARGYVHIVGRRKDMIISGGFNVYPKEVESEIDALAGIVESAVIGLSHRDFGEGVAAVVVAAPDATLSEGEIISALRERLAAYKLPKRVIFLADLPRNSMGKVQKNLLREQYAGLFA